MYETIKNKKGWVVFNENGYDELTTTSNNFFIEIINGQLKPKKKSVR